jgi:hypothetical protein
VVLKASMWCLARWWRGCTSWSASVSNKAVTVQPRCTRHCAALGLHFPGSCVALQLLYELSCQSSCVAL